VASVKTEGAPFGVLQMTNHSLSGGRATELVGRLSECEPLDLLIAAVRAGESRVLVVRDEPGVGKTALLEHVVEQSAGCLIARAAGVQPEMELAYAGLHQHAQRA